MFGRSTPNINGEGYFIRGGRDDKSASTQEAMIDESMLTVTDNGHGHTDSGHKHTASTSEHKHSVHTANYNREESDDMDDSIVESGCFETQSSPCSWSTMMIAGGSGSVTVSSATATISSSTTGIDVGSFGGTETRPKNMAAVYIMRIF